MRKRIHWGYNLGFVVMVARNGFIYSSDEMCNGDIVPSLNIYSRKGLAFPVLSKDWDSQSFFF